MITIFDHYTDHLRLYIVYRNRPPKEQLKDIYGIATALNEPIIAEISGIKFEVTPKMDLLLNWNMFKLIRQEAAKTN